MKKNFVKLMSRLRHSTIHQVMWYFWVFIVNTFSLLWSFFCFCFSRKLYFRWSHCLLLIAESISFDTSGKPTVGIFLKITFPSWIILSISLNELNSIDWLIVEEMMMNFLEIIFILLLWKNFYMAKNIRDFLENLTDNFLNIIVNVNFFGDLKFEYYWALHWNTSTSKP